MPHFESRAFFSSFFYWTRQLEGLGLRLGLELGGDSVLMAMGQAMSGLWFYCLATDLYLLYYSCYRRGTDGIRNVAAPHQPGHYLIKFILRPSSVLLVLLLWKTDMGKRYSPIFPTQ